MTAEGKKRVALARTTHGMRYSRIYNTFHGIRRRCNNKNDADFKNYGARGIRLLWSDFSLFLRDMGASYAEHVSKFGEKNTWIDRIDPRGNYCKENCRWATAKVQQNNRTNNNRICFQGRTQTLTQWAEQCGMSNKRLWARLNRDKMSIEEALGQPLRQW